MAQRTSEIVDEQFDLYNAETKALLARGARIEGVSTRVAELLKAAKRSGAIDNDAYRSVIIDNIINSLEKALAK